MNLRKKKASRKRGGKQNKFVRVHIYCDQNYHGLWRLGYKHYHLDLNLSHGPRFNFSVAPDAKIHKKGAVRISIKIGTAILPLNAEFSGKKSYVLHVRTQRRTFEVVPYNAWERRLSSQTRQFSGIGLSGTCLNHSRSWHYLQRIEETQRRTMKSPIKQDSPFKVMRSRLKALWRSEVYMSQQLVS